jgi:hypothetical protein
VAAFVKLGWLWVVSLLACALLFGSAIKNLRPTPVIRLFRDGNAIDIRIDPLEDEEFKRLIGELSSVHGALGFASLRMPGVPIPGHLDGLVYILTHDKLSQTLHFLRLCYRQAVAQIRAGEFASCRSVHFIINPSVPWNPESRQAVMAALTECEESSTESGERVRAEHSWVGEPTES